MKTILIVDDEVSIRTVLSLALSDSYNILEADNGMVGLELFEKHNPDLIITDCRMPIMTGCELVRKIRASNHTVKIIAHTTLSASNGNNDMLEAGADLCFYKPTSLDKIEQAISSLLLLPVSNKKF